MADPFPFNGVNYYLKEGTYQVGNGDVSKSALVDIAFTGTVVIEEFINKIMVTQIAKSAFSGSRIKEVFIKAKLTKIGLEPFLDCAYLEYINIPETLEELPARCFQNSGKGKTLFVELNSGRKTPLKMFSYSFEGPSLLYILNPNNYPITELGQAIFVNNVVICSQVQVTLRGVPTSTNDFSKCPKSRLIIPITKFKAYSRKIGHWKAIAIISGTISMSYYNREAKLIPVRL